MKQVISTYKELQQDRFRDSQFIDDHPEKNILFISPQLSGQHLYKFILPYIVLYEQNLWNSAFTSLTKYSSDKQVEIKDSLIRSHEIMWADYVVIPFTTQNLATSAGDGFSLYQQIRDINPEVKIIYHVDYNYYLLPTSHPYHSKFQDRQAIKSVEDNIFYADTVVVTNFLLQQYLHDVFKELKETGRYKNRVTGVAISCLPMLSDPETIFENMVIEHDDQKPKEEEANASDQENELPENPESTDEAPAADAPKNKPPLPEGFTPPTIKDLHDYYTSKGYEDAQDAAIAFITVHDNLGWVLGKEKKVITAWKKLALSFYKHKKEEFSAPTVEPAPIKVGIVASKFYHDDIRAYAKELRAIKEKYGDNFQLVVFGYNGEDEAYPNNALEGIEHEYVRPVTINHYFKTLYSLKLDALFIPLRKTEYNETSENYNKFIEAALLKVPVITYNIFPYSELLTNESDGFMINKKAELIELIGRLIDDPSILKKAGQTAMELALDNFCFHDNNMELISKVYS